MSALPVFSELIRPAQQQMLEQFSNYSYQFGMSGMGSGKLQPCTTLIPTVRGWKQLGDIRDGDVVFDEQGRPCNVVKAHEPITPEKAYAITFDTGETVEAGSEHLWGIRTYKQRKNEARRKSGPGPMQVVDTQTVYELYQTEQYALSIDVLTDPVPYPERELPVDPYTLGVWLGDGHTAAGRLTIAHIDEEIIGRLDAKYSPTISPPTYHADGTESLCHNVGVRGLRVDLRLAGVLDDKHIPAEYLVASVAQRTALLQGLMDTDGSCNLHAEATGKRRARGDARVMKDTGACEFYASNERLATQVQELVNSLGFKASLRDKQAKLYGVDKKVTYTVTWMAPKDRPMFTLARKIARQAGSVGPYSRSRYITNVEPCEPVEMRCLTVDSPSRLFLCTTSYIPTHNTATIIQTLIESRRRGIANTLWIVTKPTVAKTVWPAEVDEWQDFSHLRVQLIHGPKKYDRLMSPADIYVTTFHGLAWILQQCPDPAQRKRFLPGWGEMLVVDESAAIKNPKSNAFAAVWWAATQNEWKHKISLNATPSIQDRTHIWGQYSWLDKGERLGRPSITNDGRIRDAIEFQDRFCASEHTGFGMKHSMPDSQWFPVLDMIGAITYCVRTKDVAQLPQFDLNVGWLELDQRSQEVHDAIRAKLGVELDQLGVSLDDAAASVSALVEAEVFDAKGDAEEKVFQSSGGIWYGLCAQACSGNIYLNGGETSEHLIEQLRALLPDLDGRAVYPLHDAKANALLQLLHTQGTLPALVSYKYKHEHQLYADLLTRYQIPFETLSGRTPAHQARAIIKRFREGKLPVLLGHPASLGHGLNLQGWCRTAIFTSPLDSADQFTQFICRVYRPGVKVERFAAHVLTANNTLESELVLPRMLKRREDFDVTEDYLIARQIERLGPIPGSLVG